MIITDQSHPNIIKAFHAIEEDNAGPRAMCFPMYDVPSRYDIHLADIEKAISELSRTEPAPESSPLPPHVAPDEWLDSEFWTFVNGEYTEQLAIANRSMDLTVGFFFLNDYFEDWDNEEDVYQRALVMRIEYWDSMNAKVEADNLRAYLK